MTAVKQVLEATGLFMDGHYDAFKREIVWDGVGWYSMDDDGVYRIDARPYRGTFSRIKIQDERPAWEVL